MNNIKSNNFSIDNNERAFQFTKNQENIQYKNQIITNRNITSTDSSDKPNNQIKEGNIKENIALINKNSNEIKKSRERKISESIGYGNNFLFNFYDSNDSKDKRNSTNKIYEVYNPNLIKSNNFSHLSNNLFSNKNINSEVLKKKKNIIKLNFVPIEGLKRGSKERYNIVKSHDYGNLLHVDSETSIFNDLYMNSKQRIKNKSLSNSQLNWNKTNLNRNISLSLKNINALNQLTSEQLDNLFKLKMETIEAINHNKNNSISKKPIEKKESKEKGIIERLKKKNNYNNRIDNHKISNVIENRLGNNNNILSKNNLLLMKKEDALSKLENKYNQLNKHSLGEQMKIGKNNINKINFTQQSIVEKDRSNIYPNNYKQNVLSENKQVILSKDNLELNSINCEANDKIKTQNNIKILEYQEAESKNINDLNLFQLNQRSINVSNLNLTNKENQIKRNGNFQDLDCENIILTKYCDMNLSQNSIHKHNEIFNEIKTNDDLTLREADISKSHISSLFDDIEDMNTIIRKLDLMSIDVNEENLFSLNNIQYQIFSQKFDTEIESYLFPNK